MTSEGVKKHDLSSLKPISVVDGQPLHGLPTDEKPKMP